MTRTTLLWLVSFMLVGCPNKCDENSLTNPSTVPAPRDGSETWVTDAATHDWRAEVPQWSRNIGIHAFAWHEGIQQPYLQALVNARAVRRVRIELSDDTPAAVAWADANHLTVLGLFSNQYLTGDVESAFDGFVASHPTVRFWEIGNEVKNFIQMDASAYAPIFVRLFKHVAERYPGLILLPEAPLGGGGGDEQLRKLLDGGILELAEKGYRTSDGRVVKLQLVAFHYYGNESTYGQAVARQIQRLPAHVRVWVTESGTGGDQLAWVRGEFPRLDRMDRVEEVFFYVATGCDRFAMVFNPNKWCNDGPARVSNLFTALTGVSDEVVLSESDDGDDGSGSDGGGPDEQDGTGRDQRH